MAYMPGLEAHLTMIRAFASVISPDNWRDMRVNIDRQFQDAERLTEKAAQPSPQRETHPEASSQEKPK